MKISIKIIALAVFASTLGSCTDFLDRYPSTELPTDIAITDYKGAYTAIIGTYNSLQGANNNTSYYASRFFIYGDVRGDFMQATIPGKRSSSFYELNYSADNSPAMWSTPYNVIRNANNVIAAIDAGKVKDGKADDVANIRGQALAIRALVHFDLCRIYGKPYTMDGGTSYGIPIVTKPLLPDALPGRSSVAEVYDQVIKDLTDAINDPASKLTSEKATGFINSWAAKALLSRVYLYKGDNALALSTAEDVINNSPYALWTTEQYAGAWKEMGSSEFIFEIVNTSDDNIDLEGLGYMMSETGYNDVIMTENFVKVMQQYPDDVRYSIMETAKEVANIEAYGTNKVYLNKYPGRTSQSSVQNVYPLRLSEIYLNAAEAALKASDAIKAQLYLNKIFIRANPTATPVAQADVTLDRILLERGKELIGEGHRFFDLMRNNKEVVRYKDLNDQGWHGALITESRAFNNTYFRIILPIPLSEREVNADIANQQNPGYAN